MFLSPNNVRDYSSLRGDTGPLVYPALHLYIYSFLHKRFPAASLPDIGGFVPGKAGLEAGTAMQADGRNSLLALQGIWAGVYLATLCAVAWIYRQAILSLEKQAVLAKKKEHYERNDQTISAKQSILELAFGTSPPLQPFLLFLPLSKRLHSIHVLRLFNDPLAMLALYISIVLFCKKKWYIGAIVYSQVVLLEIALQR
jgi:alpha-1,3-mannosyltransferase